LIQLQHYYLKGLLLMKTIMILMTTGIFLAALSGCSGNRELIKTMSNSTSQDIFQEVSDSSLPSPGYADLRIYSSLKTHKPGIYSESDPHGTPSYSMLVNIDGQAVNLEGRLREEKSDAFSMRDPNEGIGIRYKFEKKLRIKAGTHNLS